MKRIETGASRRLPNSQLQAPRQDLEEHPSQAVGRDEEALPAALTSKTLIPFQPDSLDPGWPSRNTWATKIREISADWRAMRTMILIAAGLLTLAMACSFTETPTSSPASTHGANHQNRTGGRHPLRRNAQEGVGLPAGGHHRTSDEHHRLAGPDAAVRVRSRPLESDGGGLIY